MKYKKSTVNQICQTLVSTGDRKTAIKTVGISEETFYKWMKKPEFSESVHEAEKKWRDNLPFVWRKQANKAFEDYLFGRVVETWTTIEGDRKITKTVQRGVPAWAIERVLGKPTDLLDALTILVREEVLPPEVIDSVSRETKVCIDRLKKALINAFIEQTKEQLD